MNTPVKMFFLFFTVLQLNAQVPAPVPSVQLKVKEKSGLFGMGGPRIVQIEALESTASAAPDRR